MTDIVNLNIGGHKFTTRKSTLVSIGENFFSGLLSGRIPPTLDSSGYHFIDSNEIQGLFNKKIGDGKYFEPILEFLRTSQLIIPPNIDVGSVYREAEFYGVDLPIPSLPTEDKEPRLRYEGVYFNDEFTSSYAFAPDGSL